LNSSDDATDAELLKRYRQASSAEARAPRDAVRAAILEEGHRAAAAFADSSSLEHVRRRPSRWKMTALATAATIVLAAVVIAPRLWERDRPGSHAGAVTNSFKQAAVRKAQPDAAEYASRPTVPVVPVQPASPAVSHAEQMSALSQRSNVAARSSAEAFARRQAESGALLAAAARGDSPKATQLLSQADFIDERDDEGRTPLLLAVAGGRLDMVRLLLEHGADPNAADRSGLTPLAQARQKGYVEIAAALTHAGAR
jgi:hypothetical protein